MELLGVAHIHSHTSYDSKLTLAEIRSALLARGVRFALMAEHTDQLTSSSAAAHIQECSQYSDDRFLFIPGFEIPYLGTHILVLGAYQYHQGAEVAELLARWRADGALLVLAHPHRNGFQVDPFLREHLDGIEIWNSQYDGIRAPRRGAWQMFSSFGTPVRAYASLDAHRLSQVFGPQLAVQAPALTESEIMNRLRQGAFSIRQGSIEILSDGTLIRGNRAIITATSLLMPMVVGALRRGSSLLAKLGIRSFPLKRWLRSHV